MSTGSWELPEEYRMLRDTVRRFMERDVKPIEDSLPHDANAPGDADLERLQRTAREMGLWCVQSPKAYGGAGLSRLFDVSAVGNPKDGDLRCKYGIATWDAASATWSTELVRLDYPLGETEVQLLESDVPDKERVLKKLQRASYGKRR